VSGVQERALPDGWRWARLGEVCAKVKNVDPRRRTTSEFDYIDISAVNAAAKKITGARTILATDAPSRAKQLVHSGDLLVSTTRPNLNAVAMVPEHLSGAICSTGFCVLRASPDVNRNYLFAQVQHPDFVAALTALTQGALYPAVTDRQVKDQLIPLPPLLEQRRIADLLDAAMAQQARARRTGLAALTEIDRLELAAMISQLGAPITVEEQDEAPSGWSWRPITDVARLESGHTPSRRRPEWWGGDVPWIALPDIRALDGQIAYDTAEQTNEQGLANSSARLLPAGTVVLSRTASVGFVTRMGRPMATSQDFVNWVCGPKLRPEYLTYALIASRPYLQAMSAGAIHKTIYMPTVKSFCVCLPPRSEQERIVTKLDEIRANAASARRASVAQLAAIDALPAALLSAAFRGDL